MADEIETGHHGFIIGVVIFWILAGGTIGTAFVFFQETERARIHTEQMEADHNNTSRQTQDINTARVKLRVSLHAPRTTSTDPEVLDQETLDAVKAVHGDAPDVDKALAAVDQHIADKLGQIGVLTIARTNRGRHLERVQAERASTEATYKRNIEDIERRTRERTAAINTRVGELSKTLVDLTKRIDELEARVKSENDTILEDRIEYQTKLKILLKKREDLKNELRLILQFRPRIVGKVLGADMALNFAFVSLGSDHGVKPGMRFSVYPPGTVFRPGLKPKASVEIKRVEPKRSQARVVHQNLSDPVVTGDVLVNIALDPTGAKKPSFVLVRFLDIDGDNVDDRDDIVGLIETHGGQVLPVDHRYVDVNTDFLLMGEEWNRANDRERIFDDRDGQIIDKARRRSVTELDLDTFLNYIGFPKWK